jgi:dTDP-4-amino-4,6-dideoxygalactose transaminase
MGSELALLGGPKAVTRETPDMRWPVVTDEDREAVLGVLEAWSMSDWKITIEFERQYAAWIGQRHALAYSTGTGAIHGAMFGLGWGRGDEIITPTWTYWGTHTQLLNVHAVPVFCDIEQNTLCLSPDDVERRITPRTRGIIVVHMCGYPAEMDRIMQIADRHGLQVLEDYSHAHGSVYRGRKVGSIGHANAASIMSGKPLATGEGGMLNTDDTAVYERALMLGHYERHAEVTDPELLRYAGPAWGGHKYRMHQMTSALGRVQLAHYDEERLPGLNACNRLFSQLEGLPGVRHNWPLNDPDRSVATSYAQRIILDDEIIDRVPNTVIAEAVRAEGVGCSAGGFYCHHLHPYWNELDLYHDGMPTRQFFAERDVTQGPGDCPVAERINDRLLSVPRMPSFEPEWVDQVAAAYRKVFASLDELEGMSSSDVTDRSRTLG